MILTDFERTCSVPILVNRFESDALALAVGEVKPERPLSHQLLQNTIEALGWKVVCVEIIEGRAGAAGEAEPPRKHGKDLTNLLNAVIHLVPKHIGSEDSLVHKAMDARPVDAVVLALRAQVPILVQSDVLARHAVRKEEESDEADTARFKEFVQSLKASDFNQLSSS